jgi:UDP-glucose:(heptosyl)LPS alpha-1,3-glucosyltransferase
MAPKSDEVRIAERPPTVIRHIAILKSRAKHPGGLEKYAARIVDGFKARGEKVTVLEPAKSRLPAFVRLEINDRKARKWVEANRPDIVLGLDRTRHQTHYRAGNGVHAAYLDSRRLSEGKLKWLLSRINPQHLKILDIEKCAFENPNLRKLFTNSHMVRKEILSYYKTDPSKIEVIHNGVEWAEMRDDFEKWEEKKRENNLGVDPSRFHLLFVGHGFRRKGLHVLLDALEKWSFRDYTLSVVGYDKHLSSYRSTPHVRFFGPRRDVRLFYQLADCVAIPSFYDPFANVTLEALSMGLFVISSKSNGGSEILSEPCGSLIENLTDPDSIIEALDRAVSFRKTRDSALRIRELAKPYEASIQVGKLIDACR